MGVTVREKKKGEWWVFISYQGKRKYKKIGRDKRLALDVAKKIEARLALGDFNLDEKKEQIPTFAEYAARWIATTVPATCKASTLRDYRSILDKHVLPAFGKKGIDEINRSMVKEFLMSKANEGFSGSTLTHLKNVISGTLNLAVDDEIISFNPAQRLGKAIKTKPRRLSVEPLTSDELALLLETFRTHYPRHYPLALTLARTGMRVGEALALQWGDVDFHGRFISVQRGFSRGRIETPKNGKARRVDMSKQLTQTLIDLLKQRKEEKLSKGWKELPEWVFISQEGTPISKDNWRRRIFEKVLAKAGLRRIRVHDLRHTYASLLIQAGESLAYIRDQLGHHSIKVTVDIYGHLEPGKNKAAVDRLDDIDAPICTPDAPYNKKALNRFS